MMVVLLIALALAVALCFYAVKTSERLAHYRNDRDPDRYVVNGEYLEALKTEPFRLYPLGYEISGELALFEGSKKAVVLAHGITASRKTVSDFAELFRTLGYHVLVFDLPNHGKSGGDHRSFGFFEKKVILACVNYLRQRLGDGVGFGLFGISMGAASVLLAASACPDCRFVIADCAYEDLSMVIGNQLVRSGKGVPPRVGRIFSQVIALPPSIATRLRYGWKYADCAPIDVIDKIIAPVLFIHGRRDRFVPAYMSGDMHEKRTAHGLRSSLELFDAVHGESFHSDPARYRAVVEKFLSRV